MRPPPPPEMTAVAVEGGKGGPEALHAVSAPTPTLALGQVLIRVAAAGVNRPDLLQRRGFYPPPPGAPTTLGLEVSGEVAAVDTGLGEGRWKVGDQVAALLGGGGYAEYAAVDARHCLPIPPGRDVRALDWIEASALPETLFTVFANVFEHGALKAGETFMVHGATSGIGSTAIQMAKAAGAFVIATGRGADKVKAALDLGADVAVNAKARDFAEAAKREGGADVILDMVAGDYFARNIEALNTGGRLVHIAFLGGNPVELNIQALMAKRLVVTGSTLRPRSADEKARLAREVEHVAWPWVASGQVRPVIDATFRLEQAAQAHAHLEAGEHVGKVVLTTAFGRGETEREA